MGHNPVKHAVFPVAGLGTRFLPATKAVPKEMLPIATKPLIQYAYEEALQAGIEHFVFVDSDGKQAIHQHFAKHSELEAELQVRGKEAILRSISDWLPKPDNITFVKQDEQLGLGHAVLCAKEAVGNQPFAVLLPDEMVMAEKGVLAQMVEVYHEVGGNILAVAEVPKDQTDQYGILDVEDVSGKVMKAKGMVEKPATDVAPSNLCLTGRYILQPEIFYFLENTEKSVGSEIQLTDSMAKMLEVSDFYGYIFDGRRFDCGQLPGFIEANMAYALKEDEARVRPVLEKFLSNL